LNAGIAKASRRSDIDREINDITNVSNSDCRMIHLFPAPEIFSIPMVLCLIAVCANVRFIKLNNAIKEMPIPMQIKR
jgi:hypothetical protein